MDLGLDRINKLLNALGNPQDQLKVIHVAGTNGKGSVCAYTSSVLRQLGFTVGRFNSPHLLEPHDSIHMNDDAVSKEEYKRVLAHVGSVNDDQQLSASLFEQLVATALCIFSNHKLDWAVIEVGLGGSLDATNVFKQPKVTIVTAIGWDHAGILGNTMEAIAQAKAGIMKPGCRVVLAPQEEDGVMETLVQHAEKLNAPYKLVKEAEKGENNTFQLALNGHIYQYSVPLRGDYQRANSAAAVTALAWLRETGDIQFNDDQLRVGMAAAYWPGRLEEIPPSVIRGNSLPSILVDGAHNPPATRALRKYVDTLDAQNIVWIMGMTTGKDIDGMLKILLRPQDTVFAVPFTQPEDMPWIHCVSPTEIQDAANMYVQHSQTFDDLWSCLQALPSSASHVVMCGSLYLVADFFRLLKE
ncbi:Mur ligase [Phascolomyces articulosus]|uniref:Dihydrofolate synthetase n=1 Tax=Phascolomyces articulosus TaxID=60185 RepID=A0AAD5KE92_9FUNG|nr:Mur ligase [Phascolomyces articulosus]